MLTYEQDGQEYTMAFDANGFTVDSSPEVNDFGSFDSMYHYRFDHPTLSVDLKGPWTVTEKPVTRYKVTHSLLIEKELALSEIAELGVPLEATVRMTDKGMEFTWTTEK